MNPHPRYTRGKRLSAEDVRRARQQGRGAERQAQPARGAPRPQAVGRAVVPPDALPTARRRWSNWKVAAVGVPLAVVAVVLVIALPTLLKARTAYNQIFVTPAARPVVTENAEGTPVIIPNATEPVKLPNWDKKERVNILLLGVDRRENEDVPRSDTMIIVTIDPATKQVGMLSIPRDLLVTIPGIGEDKINAAYPAGEQSEVTGPGLVRATIEYNFDIPIHYFAEVDFVGFQKIVDTLGGVTIDVPAPIKDDEYPGEKFDYTRVYFHTGLQHMDGKAALQYARTRHDDNDFARGARQQQVLRALREQGVKLNLITKAPELLEQLGNTVRTDIPPKDVLALANLGTEIKGENIHSYNLLDAVSERWSPGEPYYLVPDWDRVHEVLAQMMPGSATGEPTEQPDMQATILVENATRVDKLASRNADKLRAAGFADVSTAQSADTGNYPESQIVNYSGNMATARLIAETLDLPPSAIVDGDLAAANGNDVVVILGDDAGARAAP